MNPNIIIIDDKEGLSKLRDYLKDKEIVSFDTETTGIHRGAQIIGFSVCGDESEAFYAVLGKWNTLTNSIDSTNLLKESADIISDLKHKKLIMHNAVFDCARIEETFRIRLIESLHTDTMVLAHILNENRRIGLKELAKEYFGEDAANEQKEMKESVLKNGGKLTKTSYEMYKCDPYIMGKYGAKDAWLTYKLFLELLPDLYDQGLDKFFYEDESMPLLKGPTYDLNTAGLKVDIKELTVLKKTLEAECCEDLAFIKKEIDPWIKPEYAGETKKTTFNINSNQQLGWLIFGKLGLEFDTLTEKGKSVCRDELGMSIPYKVSAKKDFINGCITSVNKKINNPWKYIKIDTRTLQKFSKKYKWIEKLLEYKKKIKLLNTYVEGIEERIQYGVIYPSFLQHGTTSGRYSSRNPNFQNLPRDDKRIKGCIVSRPGRVFVGADYSQLEPRVFAYFSGDTRLRKAFDGESDFYSVIGMEVFNKTDCTPQKEGSPEAFGIKYKSLRNLSKTIALASTYGATARQLAPTTGKSIEDTQEDIDRYFETFPGVKEMMLKAHASVKKHGRVENYFGRPRRMPEAIKIKEIYGNTHHSELPYKIRNILNLAVNHTIQSTGASIVNRAAIAFYNRCKELKIEAKIVLQVHDSFVVECPEKLADIVASLLKDCMEKTVELPGITLEALPKIGHNLAEV